MATLEKKIALTCGALGFVAGAAYMADYTLTNELYAGISKLNDCITVSKNTVMGGLIGTTPGLMAGIGLGKTIQYVRKNSDKIIGWGLSTIGAAGVLSGIGLVIRDPKDIIGYTGTVASAGAIMWGIKYLKKTYRNR